MTRARRRSVAKGLAILVGAAALFSACGTSDDSEPTSTSTSIIGSVGTGDDAESGDEPAELRTEVELQPDVTYQTGPEFNDDLAIRLTSPVAANSYIEQGLFGLSLDPDGNEPLLTAVMLENAGVYRPNSVDGQQLLTNDDLLAVTEPAPDDVLSWFTARPYVQAGPATETELGGYPARSVTYTIGDVEGSLPCTPEPVGCMWSVVLGDTSVVHLVGDTGTLYQVDVDGAPVLVDVSDRDGAEEIATAMDFIIL
jgi:hypothetical protein